MKLQTAQPLRPLPSPPGCGSRGCWEAEPQGTAKQRGRAAEPAGNPPHKLPALPELSVRSLDTRGDWISVAMGNYPSPTPAFSSPLLSPCFSKGNPAPASSPNRPSLAEPGMDPDLDCLSGPPPPLSPHNTFHSFLSLRPIPSSADLSSSDPA